MGIFDIFKGNKKNTSSAFSSKEVARYADAISKRAQNYDRQEAVEALSKMKNVEAASALLKRFTFTIEPSIIDEEEKDTAYRGIVSIGKEALPALREFCRKAESIRWPLRIMNEILEDEEFVTEILAMLEALDTEYDRNPDPKIQLISSLETIRDPRISVGIQRFLHDVNEPTRFHTVSILLAQEDSTFVSALVEAFLKEEAVRTQNRILEGISSRMWPIPEDMRERIVSRLSYPWSINEDGVLEKFQ